MDVMTALDKLEEEIQQWKCPACGGSKFYKGYSQGAPNGRECTKCEGTGLHPLAVSCLAHIRELRKQGDR